MSLKIDSPPLLFFRQMFESLSTKVPGFMYCKYIRLLLKIKWNRVISQNVKCHMLKNKTQLSKFGDVIGFIKWVMDWAASHPAPWMGSLSCTQWKAFIARKRVGQESYQRGLPSHSGRQGVSSGRLPHGCPPGKFQTDWEPQLVRF